MEFDCTWIAENFDKETPSQPYGCEWLKAHWADVTKSAPYPCTFAQNYFETQKLAVTVAAATKDSYWGTAVSAMQSGITVTGDKITGTLKYLDEGQLVTDWGAGNFIALKFTVPDGATSCKVGLNPTQGSGMQELDEDKDGVFKITDNATQKLVVVTTNGQYTLTQEFDLSELTCETE